MRGGWTGREDVSFVTYFEERIKSKGDSATVGCMRWKHHMRTDPWRMVPVLLLARLPGIGIS
jgi:hypothetical protein